MQEVTKAFIGSLVIGAYFLMFLASATPQKTTSTKPGFYGVSEWWNGGSSDVNGEVGHRLYVGGPRARCITCNNCQPGPWQADHMIVSGNLPPGMSFDNGTSNISGIPSERGHWIVKIKLYNIRCNGLNFDGCCSFTQELRFHITGTGRVNN